MRLSCRSYGAWLGGWGDRFYKHGAPNGAFPVSVAEDACKVQGLLALASTSSADQKLALLKVGNQFYTNVVVTTVTAADIYFTHAQGLGSAKLKNLAPELQKQFHFEAAKAGDAEKKQAEANVQYRLDIAKAKRAAATATS